jgi:Raffinose synthase or seed imbibition protein Sip1
MVWCSASAARKAPSLWWTLPLARSVYSRHNVVSAMCCIVVYRSAQLQGQLSWSAATGTIDKLWCNTLPQVTFTRFLAAARKKLWWMTPEWGTEPGDLPPETQFLLLELKDGGPYAILLPLIDSDTFRATLRPPRCCPAPLTSSQR